MRKARTEHDAGSRVFDPTHVVEVVERGLKAQVAYGKKAVGKKHQGSLWTFVSVIKTEFPLWDADYAWRTVDHGVARFLGGWVAWEAAWNQPKLTDREVRLGEVPALFRNCWNEFHVILTSAALGRAWIASKSMRFPLPTQTAAPWDSDYEKFIRFMGVAAVVFKRSRMTLSLTQLAEATGMHSWACSTLLKLGERDGLIQRTRGPRYPSGSGDSFVPAMGAQYQVFAVLRDAVKREIYMGGLSW